MIQLIEKRCCIPHFVGGRIIGFKIRGVFFEWGGMVLVGTEDHQPHHDMPCNFPPKGWVFSLHGRIRFLFVLGVRSERQDWTTILTLWGYTGNVKKRMVNDAYQKRANDFCTFGDLKRICFDVNIAKSCQIHFKSPQARLLVFKAVAGGGGVFIRLCMF